MKTDIHPNNYRPVVFKDLNNDEAFLVRSTASSDETIKWEDGNEYPLIKVHISSTSHPFYTGQEKLVDVEGRVDRFKARQEAASAKKEALSAKAAKKAKKKSETEDDATQKIGGGVKQTQRAKSRSDKNKDAGDEKVTSKSEKLDESADSTNEK